MSKIELKDNFIDDYLSVTNKRVDDLPAITALTVHMNAMGQIPTFGLELSSRLNKETEQLYEEYKKIKNG